MTVFRRVAHNRPLSAAVLVLCLYVLLEALSLSALVLLGRARDIHYQPLSRHSLSELTVKTLRRLIQHPEDAMMAVDPVIGWIPRPNARFDNVRINAQGIRGDQQYSAVPSSRVRIAGFGDSFVFDASVSNSETWLAQMSRIQPSFETLNFGIPGGALDQAFLRYQHEGVKYHPDIVLIGYFSDNIRRNVNTFRVFYKDGSSFPLSKPRYILDGHGLRLIDTPLKTLDDYQALLEHPAKMLPELGRYDFFYRTMYKADGYDVSPSVRLWKLASHHLARSFGRDSFGRAGIYYPESEAFRVTVRLFDKFYHEVLRNGARPVIVLLPDKQELLFWMRSGQRPWQAFVDHFQTQGYRFVDGLDVFSEVGQKGGDVHALYSGKGSIGGHFAPDGSRVLAEALVPVLDKEFGRAVPRR